MPTEVKENFEANIEVQETSDLTAALQKADVAYITRIQKERFADTAEYEKLEGRYVVNRKLIEAAKPWHYDLAPPAARRRDRH